MFEDITNPLLSICIATYQRRDMIMPLVVNILSRPGDIELRVHVDGSNDGSYEALLTISDPRIHVTYAPNGGKACSMYRLVNDARGLFTMTYDDDDKLDLDALQTVLADCGKELDEACCGFIYHHRSTEGGRLGSRFPSKRSNFLKLRADEGVIGDKREVVRTSLLQAVIEDPRGRFRRIPMSLYWGRIGLTHDVLCREIEIGEHGYELTGITSNIAAIKRRDAWPMYVTHATRLRGWFKGRYRSPAFALRSALAMVRYGLISLKQEFDRA